MQRATFPAPQAAAPKIGLRASIPPTTDLGTEWRRGISYVPEGCVEGERFAVCDDDTQVTDNDQRPIVEWDPFMISVSLVCSTFSGIEDGRIRRALNMDTERQLGSELWDGALAQATADSPNTWLTDATDLDILSESGPVALVHGLACLQQYLAENNGGQQGVIHATSQTVTHWESFRLLRREGNRILTMQDNIVISSPGYSGTSPYGDIGDNNIWAYATDVPRIFLDPEIHIFEDKRSIDRRTNTQRVVGQRIAMVEWERCRHAGVQLAIEECDSGGS